MTEDREARLKIIEKTLDAIIDWCALADADLDQTPYPDMKWLITELRAAWEREKIMREALEFYKNPVMVGIVFDPESEQYVPAVDAIHYNAAYKALEEIEKLIAKEGE